MELQAKMFKAVQEWLACGASKVDFLANKDYTEAKFNYWLAKWKTFQQVLDVIANQQAIYYMNFFPGL